MKMTLLRHAFKAVCGSAAGLMIFAGVPAFAATTGVGEPRVLAQMNMPPGGLPPPPNMPSDRYQEGPSDSYQRPGQGRSSRRGFMSGKEMSRIQTQLRTLGYYR